MKIFFLIVSGFLFFQTGMSQVYLIESNLPPVLKADAGLDKTIALGDSARLGSDQPAQDGYGDYLFLWSPAVGLSDPTLPNPWAKPGGKSVYTLTVTDIKNCNAMDEVVVDVSGTGLPNLEIPVTIRLFPNPAHEFVTLAVTGLTGAGNLTINNMVGQQVWFKQIHFLDGSNVDLDVSRWEKGLYQVVLKTDKSLFTKTIVVY